MRITLIITLFFTLLIGCEQKSSPTESQRPNILWMIIEDFSPDLSCYGYDQVRTPNIDRLSLEGTKFNNAFTTAPVCSASRSAFMTGMFQTSIGAHHHRSHRKDGYALPDSILSAPEYFSNAGYYTANVKKGFEGFNGTGKTDLNFEHKKIFQSQHWDSLKVNQPFYAQVNFAPVHRMSFKIPNDTLTVNPDTLRLPPYYPDHPVARLDWAKYITKIELLDYMVGEVLAKLEADGLEENTIVLFMADHGRNHIRGKQWLYDPGIHIPLIIRKPGQPGGQLDERFVSGIDLLPTSLDWAGIKIPDFMEGRSFNKETYRGRDYVVAARDRCGEAEEMVRAIRDSRFKYIRNFRPELAYTQPSKYKEAYYPMWILMQELQAKGQLNSDQLKFMSDIKPVEELYDINLDPDELNNLANNPQYVKTMDLMRTRLEEWQSTTSDKGLIPEDSTALSYWKNKTEEWDTSKEVQKVRDEIRRYQ